MWSPPLFPPSLGPSADCLLLTSAPDTSVPGREAPADRKRGLSLARRVHARVAKINSVLCPAFGPRGFLNTLDKPIHILVTAVTIGAPNTDLPCSGHDNQPKSVLADATIAHADAASYAALRPLTVASDRRRALRLEFDGGLAVAGDRPLEGREPLVDRHELDDRCPGHDQKLE